MTALNNKFIINTPKTYEVRYLENKQPSKLVQFASYLGLKTVDNCSGCPEGSASRDKNFQLGITLKNFGGGSITDTVNNVADARQAASDILAGTGHWSGESGTGGFKKENR